MCLGKFDRAMVVAMIAMRMMQVTVDKVVDVIAVWYRFVSTARPVHVACIMSAAIVVRRTLIRVFRADLKFVLVDMIAMRMMQVTIMQVIDMIAVPDSSVSAVRAVLMVVVGMMRFITGTHTEAPRFI
jgi:hypothetical protein